MAEAIDQGLVQLVERIERLLQERTGINQDISDVYGEAKARGYDAAQIRRLIARRAMRPDQRAEADQVQAVYEAAVGMEDGAGLPTIADLRPDAAALAAAMLTADIVMLEDPQSAEQLAGFVLELLDLGADRAEVNAQAAAVRGRAKEAGFEVKPLTAAVRWFEQVAKRGEDAMRAGEATFNLYRGTVEAAQAFAKPVTGDAKLAAMFQKPKKKKASRLDAMLEDAAAAARARGDEFK